MFIGRKRRKEDNFSTNPAPKQGFVVQGVTMESIVALSTPVGRSAVAVVRLSGDDCIQIAKKFFSPFPNQPNLLKVGRLKTEHFCEQAMCVYFEAPRSYTGENMIEFHCHGGVAISSAVIDTCIKNGARMAQNGEFSKRAFINGKQNLTNAEGIIEMIDAETNSCVKAGVNLLENKLGKKTVEIQDVLTDVISQTEVALDYPEEDLELPTVAQTQQKLQQTINQLDKLLATVQEGKILKYGINVAIIGEPNVGKSSLLNAFLNTDRAIVSDIAGTTRDTLTETIVYKDVKFNFVDTAGIRETNNPIEAEGIKRANKAVEQADVVLFVVDSQENEEEFSCNKKVVKVFNKCDTYTKQITTTNSQIAISAKKGTNVEQLKQLIYNLFSVGQIDLSQVILTNARHVDCLTRARQALQEAYQSSLTYTLDCVAVKLKEAWDYLGEVTGTTASEEIISRIYSKFCLGK